MAPSPATHNMSWPCTGSRRPEREAIRTRGFVPLGGHAYGSAQRRLAEGGRTPLLPGSAWPDPGRSPRRLRPALLGRAPPLVPRSRRGRRPGGDRRFPAEGRWGRAAPGEHGDSRASVLPVTGPQARVRGRALSHASRGFARRVRGACGRCMRPVAADKAVRAGWAGPAASAVAAGMVWSAGRSCGSRLPRTDVRWTGRAPVRTFAWRAG
jgi:hypothetical protein